MIPRVTRSFDAVLFDVDGVLIDSATAHFHVWGEWARNRALDVNALFAGIAGERGVDTVRRVAPTLDPSNELRFVNELWLEHQHHATAFPGATELLNSLPADRWGLVTSGPGEGTRTTFERLALPLPAVIVCGEDVSHGKPNPEPYELGARLLGRAPADCLVLEDAPAGITAARAAGCYVIAVATGPDRSALDRAHETCADLSAAATRITQLLRAPNS